MSTGTSDLRQAKRFHKQKLDEIAVDRQGHKRFIGPAAERLKVSEVLGWLDADYILRKVKSWAQFQSHLKPIKEHFGDWRCVDITAEAVDTYIEQRVKAEKAPSTINRETQLLGQALRLAVERGRLVAVPTIRHLPERNARRGFFEWPEFEAVVAALPERLKDLSRFAHASGWRRGEILGLTWADVDRDGGVIRLSDSKNGRGRVLVLDGDLKALIARRWRRA